MIAKVKTSESTLVFGRTETLERQLAEAIESGDSASLRKQLASVDPFMFDVMIPGDAERQALGTKIMESGDPEAIRLASNHEGVFNQAELDQSLLTAVRAGNPELSSALIDSGANPEAFGDEIELIIAESNDDRMTALLGDEGESEWDDPGKIINDVAVNPYYNAAVQKTGETYYERGETPFGINIHKMAGIDSGQPLTIESFTHLPLDSQKFASYLTRPDAQLTVDVLSELQDRYQTSSLPSLG